MTGIETEGRFHHRNGGPLIFGAAEGSKQCLPLLCRTLIGNRLDKSHRRRHGQRQRRVRRAQFFEQQRIQNRRTSVLRCLSLDDFRRPDRVELFLFDLAIGVRALRGWTQNVLSELANRRLRNLLFFRQFEGDHAGFSLSRFPASDRTPRSPALPGSLDGWPASSRCDPRPTYRAYCVAKSSSETGSATWIQVRPSNRASCRWWIAR